MVRYWIILLFLLLPIVGLPQERGSPKVTRERAWSEDQRRSRMPANLGQGDDQQENGSASEEEPQGQDRPLQESRHGWHLSPHGTIRVLVLFAEIEYDVDPSKDPASDDAGHWPKGQLPKWKDELFDPHPLEEPKGVVTRYYHDISLGQYHVLGDHVDRLFTLRESEYSGLRNAHGINKFVISEANKGDRLTTHHGLRPGDFDMWKRGGKPGLPKEPGPDEPHSYDHVMVILRNSSLTHGQGSVDAGSSGELFGHPSDSQSRFGAMNGLPFEILKHEFNHLLLGGNNFHSGGGSGAQFQSFFLNLQGGWSMMGAAGSSLLTCTGWDRQRLGWRPKDAPFELNARDASGGVVDGDIDPMAGDTGVFVLRDFVTSGDVLRIRIPFIPEDLHQQWLWIENHQGKARNGSPSDMFHWEDQPCVEPMEPGLFMVMQVEREDRVGTNIYGGYADYLRPIPATGNYDLALRGDTVFNACPFGGTLIPFRMDDRRMNPLSGNHEQELPVFDRNNDGVLPAGDHFVPGLRVRNGREEAQVVFFGKPDHAFRMNGKRKIGMGSNPSTANMMTLVTGGTTDKYKRKAPNVRTVYLNGISVEMLSMDADGSIAVSVRTGDTRLIEDVRWCADSLVLPALQGEGGHALVVGPRVKLTIDRSITPTRINAPDTLGGMIWYSEPTRFTVREGARILMEERSILELRNQSTMHLLPGSSLALGRRARLRITGTSTVVLHGDARIEGEEKRIQRLERQGRIIRRDAGQ